MNSPKAVFVSDWHGNPYIELLRQHLSKESIEIIQIEERKTFFLFDLLRISNLDIVHFHTLHRYFAARNKFYCWIKFIIFVIQILSLKVLGISMILTVHEWKDKLWGGRNNISELKAYIIISVFSALITHSSSSRDTLLSSSQLKNKFSKKIFIIPHGNYIGVYKNDIGYTKARHQLDISCNCLTFLLFGGIHPSKGVIESIDTFNEIKLDNSLLIIAGKADKSMKKLILTKIQETTSNIIFVNPEGQIPDDDIQLYMNASDVVLLPYKVFTTSGVALLAMSFGRPCIAPNEGFFKDIFQDAGAILYNPNLKTGLENALKLAMSKKEELATMGQSNLRKAEKWSWDYIAKETKKTYVWCKSSKEH